MMFRNLLSLISATIVSGASSLALNAVPQFQHTFWWLSVIYFLLVCFIFNLVCAINLNKESYTGLLIAGTSLKLLLAFGIIATASFLLKEQFKSFSAHFAAHYVIFTVSEIIYLSYLNKQKTTIA